jgi:hypothetical protein
MRIAVSILMAGCVWAQIEQPRLGAMLTRDGAARQVFGVAGNATLGDPMTSGVLSMGCSRSTCLLKTGSAIISSTGSVNAPPGPAIFSFDGAAALVYFSETRQLMRWHDNQLDPVEFDVSGQVIAIANGLFAVQRASGVWIVRNGDKVVQSLPRGTRAVLLFTGGVVFATRQAVVLRRTDASEQIFPIDPIGLINAVDAVESFSWLGENYVQVRTRSANYALRIDVGHERMFQLPEPPR